MLAALGAGLSGGCARLVSSDEPRQTHTVRSFGRMKCAAESHDRTRVYRDPVSTGRPPSDADWLTIYQNTRNTGYNPNVGGPGDCVDHQWSWQYRDDLPDTVGMYTSPLVVGETVLLGDESAYYRDDTGDTSDNNTVIALDAATGDEQWRFDGTVQAQNTPTVHDGVVFVPSDYGELEAVDLEEREVKWKTTFGGPVSRSSNTDTVTSPRIVEGTLYTSTTGDSGTLYALDPASGRIQWSFSAIGREEGELPADTSVDQPRLDGQMRGPLAVTEKLVVTANWDGRLYAVNRQTGTLSWTYDFYEEVPNSTPVCEAPAVDGGTVFASLANRGWTYAFDAATGERLWVHGKTEEYFVHGNSPAVTERMVYSTTGPHSSDRYLFGLDRETGEAVWRTFIGYTPRGVAVDSDSVYVGEGAELMSVDRRTGDEQWWFDVTTNLYSAPAVVDEAVYAADANGNVFGLW